MCHSRGDDRAVLPQEALRRKVAESHAAATADTDLVLVVLEYFHDSARFIPLLGEPSGLVLDAHNVTNFQWG